MTDDTAPAFEPFANEADVLTIGRLSLENRIDRVTLQGDLELTRDRSGLAHARQLLAVLQATVAALECTPGLPETVRIAEATRVDNPFA